MGTDEIASGGGASTTANSVTLPANGEVTLELTATGVSKLLGTVVSSGSFDVKVDWETAAGDWIQTDTVATGSSGLTAEPIDLPARTPYPVIRVIDQSGSDQTVTGAAQFA